MSLREGWEWCSCDTDNTEQQRVQNIICQGFAYIVCLKRKYVYLSNYILLGLIIFLILMPMKKLFHIIQIAEESSLGFKIFKIKFMNLVYYTPETCFSENVASPVFLCLDSDLCYLLTRLRIILPLVQSASSSTSQPESTVVVEGWGC